MNKWQKKRQDELISIKEEIERVLQQQKQNPQASQESQEKSVSQASQETSQTSHKSRGIYLNSLNEPHLVYVKKVSKYGNPLMDIIHPKQAKNIWLLCPTPLKRTFLENAEDLERSYFIFQYINGTLLIKKVIGKAYEKAAQLHSQMYSANVEISYDETEELPF